MSYRPYFFYKYREIIFGVSIGVIFAVADFFIDYWIVIQSIAFSQYVEMHFINLLQLIEHFVYVAVGFLFGIIWWRKSNQYRQVHRLTTELEEKKNLTELLLDIMTHDLNNLNQNALTRVELLRHLLVNSKYEKEKVLENFDGLRLTTKYSNLLIDNVKILSQLEANKINTIPIGLFSLFESAKEKVQLIFPEIPIRYELKSDFKDLRVEGHSVLENVFINLFSNSCRYRKHEQNEVKIDIEVAKTNELVQISFLDYGSGINDDLKEVIFNRFTMLQAGQHGLGLGLSISKRIIEQFGGKIWVENHPNSPDDPTAGSVFKILLNSPSND